MGEVTHAVINCKKESQARTTCMWYPEGKEEKWMEEIIKQSGECDHVLDIFNDNGI